MNFGRFEQDRIIELPDRRVLYLPRGRGGPLYLIPDDETRVRLERQYKVLDRVLTVALGVGMFAAGHYDRWDLQLALAAGVWLIPGWLARRTVECLPEVHDWMAVRATAPPVETNDSPASLAVTVIMGAAGVGLAMWFHRRGDLGTPALMTILVAIGLGAATTLVLALRARARADMDPAQPCRNQPIEPR